MDWYFRDITKKHKIMLYSFKNICTIMIPISSTTTTVTTITITTITITSITTTNTTTITITINIITTAFIYY